MGLEELEQIALMQWATMMSEKYPELKLLFHIPNGGKRTMSEAVRFKRAGVKAGVPDLFLPVARGGYHGLFIELKVGKNTPTKKQAEWLDALTEQHYKTAVCYGAEEALNELVRYLKRQ